MSRHQVDSTHESRTVSRDTVSMLWKFGLMVLVGAVKYADYVSSNSRKGT